MKVRPSALILQNGRLLTLQYTYGEQYVHMLPGGNVDPGELLPQTIQRELQEELGIEVEVHDLIGLGEVVSWLNKEDVLHCVFAASIRSGELQINPSQCSAQRIVWLTADEIENTIFYPNIPAVLKQYFEKNAFCGYFGQINQPEIK